MWIQATVLTLSLTGLFSDQQSREEKKKSDDEARAYVKKHADRLVVSHGSSPYHAMLAAMAGFAPDRKAILEKQRKDGSLGCICPGRVDTCNEARHARVMDALPKKAKEMFLIQVRCYVTSCYAVVLQMKDRPLKILQKK